MTRTAVLTGATGGLGQALATGLAPQVDRLFLLGRNDPAGRTLLERIQQTHPRVQARFQALDFSDLRSLESFGKDLLQELSQVDVLVNNAACLTRRRQVTPEGFDHMFTVNVLAPFSLTRSLLPALLASSRPFILNLSSNAHRWASDLDLARVQHPPGPLHVLREYGTHKLLNLLHTAELRRRFERDGLRAQAHHPGEVATSLGLQGPWYLRLYWQAVSRRRLPVETAAQPLLAALQACDTNRPGNLYLEQGEQVAPSSLARDPSLATLAWERCEELMEVTSTSTPGAHQA